MTQNYIVTAHKSTAVTDAVTGNFTSPDDINLIEARGSSLLVNLVTPEGLKPILDANIYGRIAIIQLFRPKNERQDMLFVMTARYHVAILSFDPSTGDLVTRASGEMLERVSKPTEGRQIGMIDPDCKMIALHIYTGLLKVIPLELDSGEELKAFNVRLDDLYVIDMKFMYGHTVPTIAYLTEEANTRLLKTGGISVRDKELVKGPWKPMSVEAQASLLYPVRQQCGGILVFGYETISYCSEKVQHAIDPPTFKESIVSCVGMVDGSRYLVGDANGRLLMLFVDTEEKMDAVLQVSGMKLEILGDCSSPSCVCYLDNSVVFVGSAHGDSQLLKLNATADPNGSYVQVLDTYTSLAPIIDMSVVDLDRQGHDLIVTCSGFGRDGSLRVVRSGVGINEAASIDLSGVKGVWPLHGGPGTDQLDNMLVVSFVGHTTVLSLKGEEVEETEVPGLVSDQQTFFCGNVAGKSVVQITSSCVRLINEETLELVCDWHPPSGRNISTAACNPTQIVVAVGCDLFYLEVKANKLNEVSHVVMRHEVSCVDITPVGERKDKADLCAIGLWTEIAVQVLFLPSLEVVHTQMLGGDIIPRSVLMVSFGGCCYLLCALGDGTLHYYSLDQDSGQLSQSKRVLLGTKPITLKAFQSSGATSVFACSNHPTIIHHSHQKLLFSNVNVKEVNYLCSLNSEAFKDSLAVVDDHSLVIGSVDQIQMLHIQTITLGETVRRIAHQESTRTFAILTTRIDKAGRRGTTPTRSSASTTAPNPTISRMPEGVENPLVPDKEGDEVEIFSVLLLDENTFEVIHAYQLCPREHAVSITSCILGTGNPSVYYVVGTAFVFTNEKEPSKGRILIFQVQSGKLNLVCEKVENGAVFQVVSFSDCKLVAAIRNTVAVFDLSDEGELNQDSSYTNNIMSLYIKTKGDFILVGDLMRSFKLLSYKPDTPQLEEISMDTKLNPVFLTAIEMVDDENYIGADGRHVFVCQKNSEATVEADLSYMLQPSRIYIGDNINVFGRGSLVMDHPGSSLSPFQGKPLLYGTVTGAIGLIGQLNSESFSLLSKIQSKMASLIKSVGNISHEVYRSFANDHKTQLSEGFVDGDLVEKFLDFKQSQMEEICKGIKSTDAQGAETDASVEDIVKLIEDLSRLH